MEENREKPVERPQNKHLKKDAGPGRPPGLRNFETIYREAVKMLAKENGETPEEFENKMIAKGVVMSRKGQYQFYKDTLDRLHGTAVQKSETSNTIKIEKLDEIQKATKEILKNG